MSKQTNPRENIPYICDFSRGGLNTRLSARIQTLLRGHRYRVYFLWGFCLFRSGKFIKRFGEEDRRMSLPGKLNFEGLTQKSIRKKLLFLHVKITIYECRTLMTQLFKKPQSSGDSPNHSNMK